MAVKAGRILPLVAVAALLCVTRATAEEESCSRRAPEQRARATFGGTHVQIKSFPFMATWSHGKKHICGASIIAARWVISAASCFLRTSLNMTWLRAGIESLEPCVASGRRVQVVHAVSFHPMARAANSIENNIGLIKVTPSFIFNEVVRPVPIVASNEEVNPCDVVSVLGWGKLTESDRDNTDALHRVNHNVMYSLYCQEEYNRLPNRPQICSNMICTLGNRNDNCEGDTGGPLVVRNKLLGVVSFGEGCARGAPSVHTDLRDRRVRQFISTTTGIRLGDSVWSGDHPEDATSAGEPEDVASAAAAPPSATKLRVRDAASVPASTAESELKEKGAASLPASTSQPKDAASPLPPAGLPQVKYFTF